MPGSRPVPKLLGLCVLILGLTALTASLAQAEVGASWSVGGAKVTEALLPQLQVHEIENKTASLLFTTKGGTKTAILCTAIEMVGMKLTTSGSVSSGKLKFTGCVTLLNGTISSNCAPRTAGAPKGTVETFNGTALIILHVGTPLLLLKAESGESLASMEMGELCSLGESVPVKGALTLKDCKNELQTELVSHLFEEGPLSSLTSLGQPTTLDGSVIAELSGAHKGLKWKGLPA
jgi:hypothetical protein